MDTPCRPCAAVTPTRVIWGCAFATLVSMSSPACLTPKRVEPLGDAVRIYNDAVRWERFEMASARIPTARRDDFLDQRETLRDDLRISHYKVVRVRRDKTGRRAKVHLKYTWHLDSKGIVRTTHTVQQWERSGKAWLLRSEAYLRGEPMPGVDDPDEPIDDADLSPDSENSENSENSDDNGDDDGLKPSPDREFGEQREPPG